MSDNRSGGPGSQQGLEAIYEKVSTVVRANLARAGTLTEETLARARKEARDWARQLKEQYGEDVPTVAEYLRRDFQEAVRQAGKQTRRSLDLDRIGVGILGFVQKMAERAGSQLESFASKLDERLTYKTGEVAGPGTLTCTQCSQHLSFDSASRIPPCPKCHSTTFRRGY